MSDVRGRKGKRGVEAGEERDGGVDGEKSAEEDGRAEEAGVERRAVVGGAFVCGVGGGEGGGEGWGWDLEVEGEEREEGDEAAVEGVW